MQKPSVFVGSSREGLDSARAIQFQLKEDANVSLWNEGAFGLGQGTLESLVNSLDRFDFAVLVVTPDDVIVSREVQTQAPRDNIMFELGLFMGRLGRSRTFAVCSNAKDLKLPSDLAGVAVARFDANHAKSDLTSALGPPCFQIRQAIRDLGVSESKRLHGLREATTQIEGMSDKVAHLVILMARSRVLELEHISQYFGAALPPEFLDKLRSDIKDLETATSPKK